MDKKLEEPCDAFLADLRQHGEMLIITMPKRTAEFMGWKAGVELRVIAQKVLEKEE